MDKVRTSGGQSFPGVASLETGFSGAIPNPGAEETPCRHRAQCDVWSRTAIQLRTAELEIPANTAEALAMVNPAGPEEGAVPSAGPYRSLPVPVPRSAECWGETVQE